MTDDLASMLLDLTRVRLTHDYPGQINTCLDELSEEQLWWRPNEQANAVANLVLHLSGSNRYYLEQVIGGRDIGRDRTREFAARAGSRAMILETWKQSQRITTEVLNGLRASQMMEMTERTGKRSTYSEILLHVTHHNAAHMGQIVWMTKMLRPGALDDIWVKMQARVLPPRKV